MTMIMGYKQFQSVTLWGVMECKGQKICEKYVFPVRLLRIKIMHCNLQIMLEKNGVLNAKFSLY